MPSIKDTSRDGLKDEVLEITAGYYSGRGLNAGLF